MKTGKAPRYVYVKAVGRQPVEHGGAYQPNLNFFVQTYPETAQIRALSLYLQARSGTLEFYRILV